MLRAQHALAHDEVDDVVYAVSSFEVGEDERPVAALLLCGSFQVRDLLVEGVPVVRDRQLAGIDLESVIRVADKSVSRLMN